MTGGPANSDNKTASSWGVYLADVGTGLRRGKDESWMTTFADLVALMLTFFVLMFSMSTVDHYKWNNLVRTLAGKMDAIQTREAAKPAVEYQIDQEVLLPGTDLDYLTPVVEQRLASEPSLASGIVWRDRGRTVLSLPAASLFTDREDRLSAGSKSPVYALSQLIQSLDNTVEVHAYTGQAGGGTPKSQGWESSLARAAALAGSLREAGYRGGIAVRGYGSARQAGTAIPGPAGDSDKFRNRIDIVIHETAP